MEPQILINSLILKVLLLLTDDFDVSLLTSELYYGKMDAVKENFEIVQNSLIVDDYLYKTHLDQ
jgi:hypothetical protein